jgi:type IV secretion system protein VirB4
MPRDLPGARELGISPIETSGEEFVPDVGHIAPDVALLSDASVLAIVQVPGSPFQLEETRERNIRRRQRNELLRNIADDNVTIGAHLVRHAAVPEWRLGIFRSVFAERLLRKYRERLIGLFSNEWFLTVIVSPRFRPGRALRRRLSFHRPPATAGEGTIRQLDATLAAVMAYLGPSGARRLGYREEGGYLHSEIAEARRLILTGEWQPVPLVSGSLGASIYTARTSCGTRAIRIDTLGGPRFAKIIALREYPAKTRTGQLSHLLGFDAPFVLSQTFRCHSRPRAHSDLYFKRTRMANAWDVQHQAMEGLDEAMEDVASGDVVHGDHNLTLAVFADDLKALNRTASAAGTIISKAGAVPVAEDGNSFAAFWSQLTGNPEWMAARSGVISTRNLTALASFEGFPAGEARGYWGTPVIRFATSGGTAFAYHPHVGDVGHTLFVGRTGVGKTLTMNLLVAALEQAMAPAGGSVVYFDKDRGSELLIRSTGGTYLALRSGEASGLAPLCGLANTPANRAFLEEWIAALMQLDGRGQLAPETIRRLSRGVARQLRLPPEQRRIGAVRAFLGFEEGGDGERLDIWTRDGALGWVFDNDHDEVRLDTPLVGFDMTALLEHRACPAVGAYLLHRIRDLMDGRRLAVVCDECRFYLLNPLFSRMIEDFALTMRKKEGMLWLAAQQPEHITGSDIGASLISQCQTMFLFPSRTADPAQYMDKLGCSPAMFRAITEEMPVAAYRSVLIKRETGSVIAKIELMDMDEEIAVLSGREATTRLVPSIREAVGDDPERFVAEFLTRYRAAKEEAR